MSDWIEVAAIALSPVIAVAVGEFIKMREHDYEAKRRVLTLIMANRHSRFSHDSIQALNAIEIVYAKQKDIRRLYRGYLDSVTGKNFADQNVAEESSRRFQEMIAAMGKHLKLDISGIDFSRGYIPTALVNENLEQTLKNELTRTQLYELRSKLGFEDERDCLIALHKDIKSGIVQPPSIK